MTIDGSSASAITACKPVLIEAKAEALSGSWHYEWKLFIDGNAQPAEARSQDVNCFFWCVSVRYQTSLGLFGPPPPGKYLMKLEATQVGSGIQESWTNAIQVSTAAQCPTVQPEERGNLLHVVGLTEEQGLWHAIRYETPFTWSPFGDVRHAAVDQFANPQTIVDVSTAVVNRELHVAVVNDQGRIFHAIRHPFDWQPFRDIHEHTGLPAKFVKVAVAETGGELHLIGLDGDGTLWHTIRHSSSWELLGDASGHTGKEGKAVELDVANVGGELHVVVLNDGGRIWHTIRHAQSWDRLGDVENSTGVPGFFKAVSCASVGGELHIVGVTADGLWHTIRHANGWEPFRNATGHTGMPEPFDRVSVAESGGELHVVAVTTDRRMWHTIRHAQTWDLFRNVEESNAGERGEFLRVSIEGVHIP